MLQKLITKMAYMYALENRSPSIPRYAPELLAPLS
jgi:hypothetical protein